jgi:hypothetical protein
LNFSDAFVTEELLTIHVFDGILDNQQTDSAVEAGRNFADELGRIHTGKTIETVGGADQKKVVALYTKQLQFCQRNGKMTKAKSKKRASRRQAN